MKKNKKMPTSKNYCEGEMIEKKVAITYNGLPWGIANAKVFYENLVYPPRKNYNYRFIKVEAIYSGKKFIYRSIKGETEGALLGIKNLIENTLK